MSEYRHILAAVEANEDGRRLLIRANALAQRFRADLSVLHIVEYVPVDTSNGLLMAPVDLSGELAEQSRKRLQGWCTELGIDATRLHVIIDAVEAGVAAFAEERDVDLVVVGHHRHKGLSSLFSHTEEGVMSHARCDVLAVAITAHPNA